MAYLDAEIVMYPAQVANDTASNGGRIDDTTPIPDAVRANVFPVRESAYLAAGGVRYRKIFFRAENDTEYPQEIRIWLKAPTAGDDRLKLETATDTETEGDKGVRDQYGACELNSAVLAGDTSLTVFQEAASDILYRNGDLIRIDDGTASEFATITGTPVKAGSLTTITITAGLANGYASGTNVSSVIEIGDRAPGAQTPGVTSASGTFDETEVVVLPSNAIPDTITLTFTSATAFTAAGIAAGDLGAGAIGSTFEPINPATGNPYFQIPAAAWGGTWLAGETVEFQLSVCVWAIWVALVTPTNTPAANPNVGLIGYYLEGVTI